MTQLGEKMKEAGVKSSAEFNPLPNNPFPGIHREHNQLTQDLTSGSLGLTKGGQIILVASRTKDKMGRKLSQTGIIYYDSVAGRSKEYKVWFGGWRNGFSMTDMGAHRDVALVFPREMFPHVYKLMDSMGMEYILSGKPQWFITVLKDDVTGPMSPVRSIFAEAQYLLISPKFTRVPASTPDPEKPKGYANPAVKARRAKKKSDFKKIIPEKKSEGDKKIASGYGRDRMETREEALSDLAEEDASELAERASRGRDRKPRKVLTNAEIKPVQGLTESRVATLENVSLGGYIVSVEPAGEGVQLVCGASKNYARKHMCTLGKEELLLLIDELKNVADTLG